MLNILLADEQTIVRNGIKSLLETNQDITIVGEAGNGLQVLKMLNNGCEVDIVLTDINMPEMDGIALIHEIGLIAPHTSVVILSMNNNEKYVTQAFNEGAMGYVLKNVNADELIFALRLVASGKKYLCAELVMKLMESLLHTGLCGTTSEEPLVDFSLREIEVLKLIAEGHTNAEMSEKLFLSKRTIEGHRQSLIDKTKSRNTAVLIKFAVQHGFV